MNSMCVSIQPSIKNEDATASNIITIIITVTVFMLLSTNCRKKKRKNEVSEAKSNCLHSSDHLSLFISPFSPVFSSIRLSSFLCRFSLIHHLVSQSLIPSPCLYSVSIFPSHDTISVSCLSLSFSSFSFSPKHCCQPPVISKCVFFVASCCVPRACFNVTQLAPCHADYCWRKQEQKMSACMRFVHAHTWPLLLGLLV